MRFDRTFSGLLVSVRSAEEAKAAVKGGASVIDVKEPDRGPLGRASAETWRAVRAAVPPSIPVSVALGEMSDWAQGHARNEVEPEGIAFRKLGLAGSGANWIDEWARVRQEARGRARWVAVAYVDWGPVGAPHPAEVLQATIDASDCSGILFDTFDKTKPSSLDLTSNWIERIARAQRAGLFVALAGGLDLASIVRLAPLQPDLFAVRGAACDRSDRNGTIMADRVAELVETIRKNGVSSNLP